MMFHLSHEMMAKTIGGDRETALRQWTQTSTRGRRGRVHSTEEYARTLPQNEDDPRSSRRRSTTEFEYLRRRGTAASSASPTEAISEKLSAAWTSTGRRSKCNTDRREARGAPRSRMIASTN